MIRIIIQDTLTAALIFAIMYGALYLPKVPGWIMVVFN